MTHTRLSHLSNDELLKLAHIQYDPITATDLEIELTNRLERLEEVDRTLNEFNVELEHVRPLLELLSEFEATDLADLRKRLETAAALEQVVAEAGDSLAQLHTLISTL